MVSSIDILQNHRNHGDLDLVLAHRVFVQVPRTAAWPDHVASPVHAVETMQRNHRQSNLDRWTGPLANQDSRVVCAEIKCCRAASAAITRNMVACIAKVETDMNRGSLDLYENEIL